MPITAPQTKDAPATRVAVRLAVVAGVITATAAGCSSMSKKKLEASYAPTESVVEVVAVLRRHVPDDTYRFAPATDFTGRNVYRASLLRLENLELLHQDALRAGHVDPVIAFAKGRALERLRAYDLAAEHFEAAKRNAVLREDAEHAARINQALAEAVKIGLQLEDPLSPSSALPSDSEQVVAGLDRRVDRLSALLSQDNGAPYDAILREEIERADVTRASYFDATRHIRPGGNVRALGELQRVIARHAPSKYRGRHLIALADLYAALAREYVAVNPPESLTFDPASFRELVDATTRIYEGVGSLDGTPEKLEAARRLEAFLAFSLQVDSERFSH
jgi:hypothetical protein